MKLKEIPKEDNKDVHKEESEVNLHQKQEKSFMLKNDRVQTFSNTSQMKNYLLLLLDSGLRIMSQIEISISFSQCSLTKNLNILMRTRIYSKEIVKYLPLNQNAQIRMLLT